jgi:hypothetical protein
MAGKWHTLPPIGDFKADNRVRLPVPIRPHLLNRDAPCRSMRISVDACLIRLTDPPEGIYRPEGRSNSIRATGGRRRNIVEQTSRTGISRPRPIRDGGPPDSFEPGRTEPGASKAATESAPGTHDYLKLTRARDLPLGGRSMGARLAVFRTTAALRGSR